MSMEPIKSIADSIPFLKEASAKSKIGSEYLFLLICFICYLVIQRTMFGGLFSTILSLYIPIRDSILAVRSPNPRTNELKKLVVVFIGLSIFSVLENCGIRKILPLFSVLKIIVLYWICIKEENANVVIDLFLRKIPNEWLRYGDSIQDAVKAAAKSVPKVDIKKNSVEIKAD